MAMNENPQWALSVKQLNEYVKNTLASDPLLKDVKVQGEISGFTSYPNGNLYFDIKDEMSKVACIMAAQKAKLLTFAPRNGLKVIIQGYVSIYLQSGKYQLYCNVMKPEGIGELYLRFEERKAKLEKAGMFDPAKKKPIPRYPQRIGIVTSRSGAAIHDMIRVTLSREPHAEILVYSTLVQGPGAADEIARGIYKMNTFGHVDVLLVGRGGGSMEDLWAFNEEIVARAINWSNVPIISCVGHESDTTIADFVADRRASTPSNAAEIAVPVRSEIDATLEKLERRLQKTIQSRTDLLKAQLDTFALQLRDPVKMLIEPRSMALERLDSRLYAALDAMLTPRKNRLDLLENRLNSALKHCITSVHGNLDTQESRLHAAMQHNITIRHGKMDMLETRMQSGIRQLQENKRARLTILGQNLENSTLRMIQNRKSRMDMLEAHLHSGMDRRLSPAKMRLSVLETKLVSGMERMLMLRQNKLTVLETRLQTGTERIHTDSKRRIQMIQTRIYSAVMGNVAQATGRLEQMEKRITPSVEQILKTQKAKMENISVRLPDAINRSVYKAESRLSGLGRTLQALNPWQVVKRGYALVRVNDRIRMDVESLEAEDTVEIEMRDGSFTARLLEIKESGHLGDRNQEKL